MPHFYDFSNLRSIKTMEVNPKGWVNPLTIEYGIAELTGPTYFWRIKGTRHTFVIPVLRLDFISSGEYEKHFTEVLEAFAEKDYSEWRAEGFDGEWMREYEKEYRRFIL